MNAKKNCYLCGEEITDSVFYEPDINLPVHPKCRNKMNAPDLSQEKKVVRHLADAYNEMCRLRPRLRDDIKKEFISHIHSAQMIIGTVMAQKLDPNTSFNILEEE